MPRSGFEFICKCPSFIHQDYNNVLPNLLAAPDELVAKFYHLRKPEDVSELLEIPYKTLVFHIYTNPPKKRYTTFRIAKKSGGFRKISSPNGGLKIIQQKLNSILQKVDEVKGCVHGFTIGKSILTNAIVHSGKKYVFNLDLKDFFPSINYGRVWGLFTNSPYDFPSDVAAVLANICCYKNELPQGAPTSPVISNLICSQMDSQLEILARKNRCKYSRYADDITFSTTTIEFPTQLGIVLISDEIVVGQDLCQIIEENGFEINQRKVRLQTRNMRQEVTGLTVNYKPNVSEKYRLQIRAMLHAWEKFGLEAAEEEYFTQYDTKHRSPNSKRPSFSKIVTGKIEFLGMVRGKNDPVYLRYYKKLSQLYPQAGNRIKNSIDDPQQSPKFPVPLIFTEGKTDWMHMKAAYRQLSNLPLYKGLRIDFREKDDAQGDKSLLAKCKHFADIYQPRPMVFVFDRDNAEIVHDVSCENTTYKDWGNNVYSFAIPIPSHRKDHPEVCIEFYYKDSDLLRQDCNGRRIYLSNEFKPRSGRHKSEDVNTNLSNKIKEGKITIIDSNVFDNEDNNVAMSKNDFAEKILNKDEKFNGIDFSEFQLIFEVILAIVQIVEKKPIEYPSW